MLVVAALFSALHVHADPALNDERYESCAVFHVVSTDKLQAHPLSIDFGEAQERQSFLSVSTAFVDQYQIFFPARGPPSNPLI